MALVKCRECGHEMSSRAAACPNCGAPPSPPFRLGRVLAAGVGGFVVLATALYLVAEPKHRAPPEEAPALPAVSLPEPPPAPDHYYADEDDGEYRYAPGLSAHDRQEGLAGKPMIRIRHLADQGGVHRLVQVNGPGSMILITCKDACAIATMHGVNFIGRTGEEEVMQVTPGTVLWEAIEDMKRGKLALSALANN